MKKIFFTFSILLLVQITLGHSFEQPSEGMFDMMGPVYTESNTTPFIIDLSNELGVKATINVTGFAAGKETEGDNEHDYITTELNYLGGEWGAHVSGKNIEFSNSRFVIETIEQKQFVLVPWKLFKSLSVHEGVQIVTLNDGTVYRGKLRTVLYGNSGTDQNIYELNGAISISIVQMPKQAPGNSATISATKSGSNNILWKVSKNGMQDVIISRPRFLYSMFHITSGGGIYKENGYFDAIASEQFGVAKKTSEQKSTSAVISNFESIAIGGGKDNFGMPVTVKAKGAEAVSGKLAVTPFGLEANSNDYLNRSLELTGNLSNGCTIVFSEWRNENELKLELIQSIGQKP